MVLTPALPFPPLARFRFGLTALDPVRLPEYAGSPHTDFVQPLYRLMRSLAGQYGEAPVAAESFDLHAARL